MAIPEFQTLMLPLLKIASDGQEYKLSDAAELLAQQFDLSDADRAELLPSGRQTKFDNRVGWARTHLGKALLLENPRWGRFRITDRGREVLRSNPPSIDINYLLQFPEFAEFRRRSRQDNGQAELIQADAEQDKSPDEILELSYQSLRATLAQDVLEQVKRHSPKFFERLVVDLLVAMGYGGSRKDAGQAVGRSGDGGIDGIIKEDRLGLDVVYIQAKRWENTVSRQEVQAFAGSLEGHRARKGVMITTSQFSQHAMDYVNRIEKKIVLIDGEALAQLMIDHNVGVAEVTRYVVKKIDQDYFDEE